MAGFSKSIQHRYETKWYPIQQKGRGNKITKQRHQTKQDIGSVKKSKKLSKTKKG